VRSRAIAATALLHRFGHGEDPKCEANESRLTLVARQTGLEPTWREERRRNGRHAAQGYPRGGALSCALPSLRFARALPRLVLLGLTIGLMSKVSSVRPGRVDERARCPRREIRAARVFAFRAQSKAEEPSRLEADRTVQRAAALADDKKHRESRESSAKSAEGIRLAVGTCAAHSREARRLCLAAGGR
jgi:hypothetical protein